MNNAANYGPALLGLICCIWPLIVHGSIIWFTRRWKAYGLRGFIPRALLLRRRDDNQV